MMRVATKTLLSFALFTVTNAAVALGQDVTTTLETASKEMGTANVTSIKYQGSGSSYNFGQAINVASPWRHLILKNYVADIDYGVPAMREEMDRTMLDGTPPFGGFLQVQFLSGNDSWNQTGEPPVASAAPAAITERKLQILLTPAGFLKGALANHATAKRQGANTIVAFVTPDGHKVEGAINAQYLVVKTETWIDDPVLGDMPIITTFSNYANFGSLKFPTRILQTEGGYPVLDLEIRDVKVIGAAAIDVPTNVRGARVPPVKVESTKIADGVWYLTGGTHHSVLAEFKEYVVMIEAPLNEERSNALISEAHRLAPGKPIQYVVNTHNHFDHLGGVRTFVAEGAIVIAPAPDVAYYQKVFRLPHTLKADKLSQSIKQPNIEGVQTKRVLTDGTQTVELYVIPIKGHSDAMIVAYLPRDKILVEADAYVPGPLNAPPSAKPDPYFLPYTVDLYERLQKLKLDVGPIAPLHGRITSMAEMLRTIGQSGN
jgi:glyoxylase-like metal-dependent hydrolase (beta-lactamase superfamily II)